MGEVFKLKDLRLERVVAAKVVRGDRSPRWTLSTVFAVHAFLLTIAIISDFGLRAWIEEAQWDRLALHLFPLVAVYAALGAAR